MNDFENSNKLTQEEIDVMQQGELAPEIQYSRASQALAQASGSGRIPPLTAQQKQLLTFMHMGLPLSAAARGAGMTAGAVAAFKEHPNFQIAFEFLRELSQTHIVVTKELLTAQYYTAISEADTSGEKIRGLDSIAKLHEIGGFARPNSNAKDSSDDGSDADELQNAANVRRRLARASDDDLARKAGLVLDLEPEEVRYDENNSGEEK